MTLGGSSPALRGSAAFPVTNRITSLDSARGLAVLAMFVAHGYDAWVMPSAKLGLGYRLTREIAASALPAFLLLAGVGIAVRLARAHDRSSAERDALRRTIAWRGARLFALGYVLNAAYAALDGGLTLPPVLLRADVLQAIGTSVAFTALLALGAAPDPGGRRTTLRASALALALVLACPWLTRLSSGSSGVLAYALSPFVRVEGISRFALVPLAAFCLAGLAIGVRADPPISAAHAPARPALPPLALGLIGVGLAAAGSLATAALVRALGGPLTPSHVAVLPNAVDGLGRALLVLAMGYLVRGSVRSLLALLGRHSLALYVLHVPFCYGRLGAAVRGNLDFAQASMAFAILSAVAALACSAVERSGEQRNRSAVEPHSGANT